jgi:membrane fusion protein, multidrug efflux system
MHATILVRLGTIRSPVQSTKITVPRGVLSMYIGGGLARAVCLAAALAAAGCASEAGGDASARGGDDGGRGGGGRAGSAPVPVTVATVEQKSMPLEIRVIGSAEAYSTVAIRSQTTGQLIAVNFSEGDEVQQGQVLFQLDRRPLEAALQQAQANLERDLANAKNAEVQATRFAQLVERGIAPREQAETARTAVSALNATVEADRAAVENAKVQLQYATITAPIAGRTGALLVNAGNLVRANDTAPLVTINQVAPVSVSFAIPESRLADLNRYQARGSLQVTAAPPNEDVPSTGRIVFVDNAVDQNTGTIRIKATFPNTDRRLWPGQYVNVVVTLTTDPGAVVVPSVAVQAGPQGPYVFKVTAEQTVEMQPVTVVRARGAETVIATGVRPGETVVTDGHLRLVPGARINPKAQPAPAAGPEPFAAQ